MRLNRKWLYLGGLVTILTLLLTLTLVLPAGAVGRLDNGSITADKAFVSPNLDDADDRTVKATVTNSALSTTEIIDDDNDDVDQVVLTVGTNPISPTSTQLLVVDLNVGTSTTNAPDIITAVGPPLVTTPGVTVTGLSSRHLPVLSDLKVVGDYDDPGADAATFTASDLGTPVIRNAGGGVFEIPVNGIIRAGARIELSYVTSKQETALANVRGDSANFDILTVEGANTPGDYSETFIVADPARVTLSTADVAIHQQVVIPSGLRGYIEYDNERISKFYGGFDGNTGTVSEGTLAADIAGTDSSAVGLEAGDVFYAQVKNAPLRDGIDGNTTVTAGPTADVRLIIPVDDSTPTPLAKLTPLVHAQHGVLQFTVTTEGAGFVPADDFPGGDLDVDYIGSDSFTFVVGSDTIRVASTDLDAADIDSAAAAAGDFQIVLPTTDDDTTITSSQHLALVSIEDDGTRCDDCKVRVGVITGGPELQIRDANDTGPENDGDPEALNNRFSVMSFSYFGAEVVSFPSSLQVATTPTLTVPFLVKLDDAPADINATTEGLQDNVALVTGSGPTAVTVIDLIDDADYDSSGRDVWLQATIASGTLASALTGETFQITYTRQVGALPQGALDPDSSDRPVIAVANGSRVRVTSGNDSLVLDAETKGPSFSDPSPSHEAGSGSPTATISVDVTDALSGVDPESITLEVQAGTSTTNTVVNKDLTIDEIEDGYRVSIDLDRVRHDGAGRRLSVSGSAETEIMWNATATDNAGNESTSDADTTNTDNNDDPIQDDYTFTVDGVNPTMQLAYTGDWFNEGTEQVEGDRRISRDNYLPGESNNTSIRVVFSETVDGTTVEASDFTVDGETPSAARWYGKGSTDGAGDEPNADEETGPIGSSVFLSVPAMDANARPIVALVGSVSDKAGNTVTEGSEMSGDGLAPSATVTVDKTLSDETVTITVETNESIRLQAPELKFWVSDALDNLHDSDLDEKDVFTVSTRDGEKVASATNPLVLREGAGHEGRIVYSGKLTVAGSLELTLSKAPILDQSERSRTGDVNGDDIDVEVIRFNSSHRGANFAKPSTDDGDAVINARSGRIKLAILAAASPVPGPEITEVQKGDTIEVTYRGTDPDPANQFSTVPSSPAGSPVAGNDNAWTYEVDITRSDRFAVTAEMEDDNQNQGSGGIADPKARDATVFEIDNALAGDSETDAVSRPEASGEASFDDPFDIELSWPSEVSEYVGDSNFGVTLTKAELDGVDVLENADQQDDYTYIVSIEDISLGQHTLRYNGEDAAGNTSANDRTLQFTVTERPTWDLKLLKGNNLISIPADPANDDINAVLGGVSEIDLVYTFEGNFVQVALPGPDGEFIGALKTIDSRHAYWVSTNSAVTVPINIGATGSRTVLPSLQVKGGQWNLVPVMSLGRVDDSTPGNGAEAGTPVDPDSYLGDFQVAFGSERGRWMRIDPDGPNIPRTVSDNGTVTDEGFNRLTDDLPSDPPDVDADAADTPLKVGMGYWVLYTEDVFITPR